jgi:hypothetical protein
MRLRDVCSENRVLSCREDRLSTAGMQALQRMKLVDLGE